MDIFLKNGLFPVTLQHSECSCDTRVAKLAVELANCIMQSLMYLDADWVPPGNNPTQAALVIESYEQCIAAMRKKGFLETWRVFKCVF